MTHRDVGVRSLVLFVNADDQTRDLYGDWLMSLGFDVMCAADAVVAAAIARACQPDLIITELQLRRSDGLLLIRRLRASAVTRDLPILVVTKLTDPEAVGAAWAAGAFAVIPSLTDFHRVQTILATALAHAQNDRVRDRQALRLSAVLASALTNPWDEC